MRVGNVKQQLVVSDKGIVRKIYLVGCIIVLHRTVGGN